MKKFPCQRGVKMQPLTSVLCEFAIIRILSTVNGKISELHYSNALEALSINTCGRSNFSLVWRLTCNQCWPGKIQEIVMRPYDNWKLIIIVIYSFGLRAIIQLWWMCHIHIQLNTKQRRKTSVSQKHRWYFISNFKETMKAQIIE